ncbi:MAG TPA: amino acid permease [Ferruginibacter sp.]|nr:amino acid permease [Ferruginibacter sp.]HRO17522.1 amino acid permease [Ferruginibacter sp.]HRQ20969.1 amino acid permease [Ferruginibacter sp.]
MSTPSKEFLPTLGLFDATMIVAGSMIGSGIFIVSADITRNVGSAGWLIGVWLITGFMTLIAALSYGELSAMFPKAGGQYVYLKEAYNPLAGFLYGWSLFAVVQTATIAAVGVAFSKFAGYFFKVLEVTDENVLMQLGSLKIYPAQLLSIFIIILLTYINTRGVKEGKWLQVIFTVVKIASLLGLIVFGFIVAADAAIWSANWDNAWQMVNRDATGTIVGGVAGSAVMGAIAAAMVGSIFSSDAWNNVTFIAGEVKNPKRNIGLSLFFGTLIVTIIYVAANLMYISVLPLESIASAPQDRVAVSAGKVIFGDIGSYVIAAMIMVSTFGCNNGLILAGARVYYTMAKDGLFFKQTAQLNRFSVPAVGLWIQCVVASLLCLSGRYGDLLDMISFVVVLFYAITIAGIFILRKKRPDAERPYRALGYPLLPALYIIMALTFCVLLIWFKPDYAMWGLIITLCGIPMYYLAVLNKTLPTEK